MRLRPVYLLYHELDHSAAGALDQLALAHQCPQVVTLHTRLSCPAPGIRPSNLREAAPFEEVQRQVADLLKGRIVVGHAIANDLEVRRRAGHTLPVDAVGGQAGWQAWGSATGGPGWFASGVPEDV